MPTGLPALHDEKIAVIGMACRLPGANNIEEFWSLLRQERCSISTIGNDRWAVERFFHPRKGEPGRSYTVAAGLIDNPRGFDAAAFKISPREAEQMDPQQRILLEVVWEALEDSGLPPSTLAGRPVGVFVGASSVDNYTLFVGDPGRVDTHFMTGNALSIVANRISYAYDLRGPSLTIDTACSSSLVALNEAVKSLIRGDVDTAIVAGVNILGAPHAFYGFSRAGMLSPTGLCRPFAADADGYVRSEGAAVIVLSRLDAAVAHGRTPRAMVSATGVNSDGRTVGLSLPSSAAQLQLLERLYGDAGIDPNALAFVEAHGTGTRVGDPAEAEAIGRALGQRRDAPLPIGSVKSNIGHLEPASGLAGVIKTILAIENRLLPATLHLETPNPDIPFEFLNLAPARKPIALGRGGGPIHAGVSAFGFGGTNAHAILRGPFPDELPGRRAAGASAQAILLSAHSEDALRALAQRYAEAIDRPEASPARIAQHAAHERDLLPHRLAVPLDGDTAAQLRRFGEGGKGMRIASGRSESGARKVSFVFSGNGSQFAGMGRRAFGASTRFRDSIETIDSRFAPLAGWSLTEALHDAALEQRLRATSTAQPLLFAVQIAVVEALAAHGLTPAVILGHSVGEVAAALTAGAVTLDQAIQIIYWRSLCQEEVRGLGGMAVLMLSSTDAERFCADAALDQLTIAAVNSPVCVTVSGAADQIDRLLALAKRRRIAAQRIPVDYPFHSPLLASVETPLRDALQGLSAREGRILFVSSVTGGRLGGADLTVDYWWRNIRQPVQFNSAAQAALDLGTEIFLEIGPRPVLTGHLREIAAAAGREVSILSTLDNRSGEDRSADPVLRAALQTLVHGGAVERCSLFGDRPAAGRHPLPSYPWQRREQRQTITAEHVDLALERPAHPLLGARLTATGSEWSGLLDPELLPYLAGHKLAGEVVVPGAALLEMAVAAGRQWFDAPAVEVEDFDILQALVIPDGTSRETLLRLAPASGTVEIFSRQRLAEDGWTLHARGRVGPCPAPPGARHGEDGPRRIVDPDSIYTAARSAGLDYSQDFRLVSSVTTDDSRTIEVELSPEAADNGMYTVPHALHPTVLDAAFHGLFALYDRRTGSESGAFLPVRFASLRVHASQPIRRAVLTLRRVTTRSFLVDVALHDTDDRVVAELRGARFQHSLLAVRPGGDILYRSMRSPWGREESDAVTTADLESAAAGLLDRHETGDDWLLLTAFARSLAHQAVRAVAGGTRFTIERLCQTGSLAPAGVPCFEGLLRLLSEFGLAEWQGEGWRLSAASRLPSPQTILRSVLADHPGRGAEVAVAARVSRDLVACLRTGEPIHFSKGVEAHFRSASPTARSLLELGADLIRRLSAARNARPIALLLIDPEGWLLPSLQPLIRSGAISVAVIGPDAKALAALAARMPRRAGLRILEDDAAEAKGSCSLALAVGIAPAWRDGGRLGRRIADLLRPTASVVTIHASSDPVIELLSGAFDLAHAVEAGGPSPASPADLAENRLFDDLTQAGFCPAIRHHVATPSAPARLATWTRVPNAAAGDSIAPAKTIRIRLPGGPGAEPDLVADLAAHLRRHGHHVRIDGTTEAKTGAGASPPEGDAATLLLFMLEAARDPVAFLTGAIMAVRAQLETPPPGKPAGTLWLVARCGKVNGKADGGRGLAAALKGFSRVLANEYPAIPVRFVGIDPDASDDTAARLLARLAVEADQDTEFDIGQDGISVSRVEPVRLDTATASTEGHGSRLDLAMPGGLGRIAWTAVERRAPREDEVEIEVAASGLNFRDVMFSLGLLPDDYLEDGFAGPTLGFECAGIVRRVGSAVAALREGDRVMAFAPAALATHVTVSAQVVMTVPSDVDLSAAATMPVAFITAWYALVHQAKLQRGESVLIHGAAGGVGIAALQIAKIRGGRIVATAGNDDKRALAELLGADLVLDSRSLVFADEIRSELGGVDVVLNSLSGEAMRRSLRALKPFGRFVELGKRDFVADTAVGLRAFAKNISYFGVDADQLLNARRQLSDRLLRDLGRLFAQRRLTPLPYRSFPADAVEDAFRLMQGSGHIGKIVITPPVEMLAPPVAAPQFQARAKGFHLVVGGTGGFGFETALWLAERGATTIVVVSRRGVLAPAEREQAERLAARGVTLLADRLDVTDRPACERLLAVLERRHGPLRGIIHAAMVLDDGLIKDLDPSRIEAVLAPKITGAVNLDLVSRTRAPDYFVLFSSATTMIGNPGQANYVAANAYLEELARTRRARGLPALAVSWGAISDAGILAREAGMGDQLKRRIGRSSLRAAEALDQLGRLLAHPSTAVDDATVTCARIDWRTVTRELPVLATPRLSHLTDSRRPDVVEAEIDLTAMIAGRTEAEALALVTETMLAEIGRILRMPPADVDAGRPFAELGMDSLMGLELDAAMQSRYGIQLPFLSIGAGLTVDDLAAKILVRLRGGVEEAGRPGDGATEAEDQLIARHVTTGIDAERVEMMREAVRDRAKTMQSLLG